MKIATTFILISLSTCIFAHEDTYKAIQLSNLHLKVMVGYDDSYQLKIAETYAQIINDFIKEIDSTQKVFIQFEEDYCSLKDEYYLLSVDSFKNSVIPLGFPFSYPYDLGYLKTEYGISIIILNADFKILPIMKLISYGLRNFKTVFENQKNFELHSENIHPITKTKLKRTKSFNIEKIDSLIQSKTTEIENKYLSQKIPLKDFVNYGFQIILNNDSIVVVNEMNKRLLKISSLRCIVKGQQNHSVFIFNSESTFYYLDNTNGYISEENNLTFSIKSICKNIICIKYDSDKDIYELSNGYAGTNRTVNYYSRQKGLIKDE